MNEDLLERFARSRDAFNRAPRQNGERPPPVQLNEKVRQYFDPPPAEASPEEVWRSCPEIPSSEEILAGPRNASATADAADLPCNLRKGAWESKGAYLQTHYQLLREDAIRPIRDVVSQVRSLPDADESDHDGNAVGIYEKVHICGVTCSTRGIAVRITFSLVRTGKKILWDQSKRLISGGLVVLTPKSDMFKTKAIVATVAARPLAGLQQNPPEIDLFFARAHEQELDPALEFVMVEERGGLYEAHRHTLLALQRMMREPFPLSEHLTDVQSSVAIPQYVQERKMYDMSSVIRNTKHQSYDNVDVIDGWPEDPESELDKTQLAALRSILTKKLAIVQGPPGTGKTHVSVQAIKIMLANSKPGDPPIIIACQTNHAIDQILRHIAEFEADFIRLGGRSKDQGVVKARTLYEVRLLTSENPVAGSLGRRARKRMAFIEKEIQLILSPLQVSKSPLELSTLVNLDILSKAQADTLVAGASQWMQTSSDAPESPFQIWLGRALVAVPYKQMEQDYGFDFEEADLEFEQLKDMEAENVAKDDEDFETLRGNSYSITDNFTCRRQNNNTLSDTKVKDALSRTDMWKIPEGMRPAIYRYLQTELKRRLLSSFREKTKAYNEYANQRRIGNWEQDETLLRQQKVIGMTTTGLSKYRGLIAALEPKVVLIEEAAETLEAPVTVACLPSLQHLILVGDHQQLRPHCHVKALENKPYHLNISLFERMVQNKLEFTVLAKQRRMIPEIRRILHPIYKDLIEDHDSVKDLINRPDVPGMGGVNSFFFSHNWPERRDEQMSSYNPSEASMIVGFFEYLAYNGVPVKDITVLTFYNGQRKRILKLLRETPSLSGQIFNVVTVDSYQGEENKIVLLSLVRSNDYGQIGFLSNVNRVCVALSRAQCGFYLFGNGELLYSNKRWVKILQIMGNQCPKEDDRLTIEPKMRLGETLVVQCTNHKNKTIIKDSCDFDRIVGGCAVEKCTEKLPCGHSCVFLCHPFSHDIVQCKQPCEKLLRCGHPCGEACSDECACKKCKVANPAEENDTYEEERDAGEDTTIPHSNRWESFAKAEQARSVAASQDVVQEEEHSNPLLDLSVAQVTKNMQKLTPKPNEDGHKSRSNACTVLVKEKMVANGMRVRRVEEFMPNGSSSTKKDWSKEASLLD